MSFLFGRKSNTKPSYTGLQLQTSSSSIPVPIAWGANRFAPNVIWYGDFQSHKHEQKAGKGAPKQTTYTYTVSIAMALCEGEANSIGRVWKDKDQLATIAEIGLSFFSGSASQTPWGYLTTKHPDQALSYKFTAYLAGANYDLGESANLPNHTFEVFSRLYNTASWTGGGDADIALIIDEFLTSPQFGVGFDQQFIDYDQLLSGPDAPTTGDSAYQTYCRAMGFGLSPVLSDQEPASDTLSRWMRITNSEIVWTGYSIKFIPYAYSDITANGVTYLAQNQSLYYITDDQFVSGGEDGSDADDPIKVDRISPEDAHNTVKMTINDRTFNYNEKPVTFKDQSMIELYGERVPSPIKAPEVTSPTMASVMVSLVGARAAYVRNTYKFVLGPEFILLEPMDIVTIFDPSLGEIDIQIANISEDDDGNLTIEAKQVLDQVAVSNGFPVQPSAGNNQNTGVVASAINPPMIFEPPADLSKGGAQVWAAVSGGDGTLADPNWGGCVVFVSTDNVNYQAIGTINTPARMGKLTANLAAYGGANPDVTNTLRVDMRMSDAELLSVDPADAEMGATLCRVGTEFLSYQDATLTGTRAYDLTTLWRGFYRTTAELHTTGTAIARLDDNIFKFDLPPEYVGVPLKFKFQSFNIFNSGYQDLSDCVAYDYTPTGIGYQIAAPAAIGLAFANRTQSDGTNIITGTVTIGTPSAGPYLDHYDVQITRDAGVTWIDIAAISASGTKSIIEPALAATNYQARVRAVASTAGGDPSAWVLSSVVNSGTLGGTVPNIPVGPLTVTGGALSNNLTWNAPSGGSPVTGYKIYAIHAPTGTFGSAVLVGTTPNLFFTHSGLGVSDTWRYWVVAYNAAGNGPELGPVNGTTTTTGGSPLEVDDEGTPVDTAVHKMDFVGAGVTVTQTATGEVEVNIPGGGGGSGALELIERRVLGSSSASETFSSLGSYEDLVIAVMGRITDNSGQYILAQCNGDSAANYYRQQVAGANASVSAGNSAQTGLPLGVISTNDASANRPGSLEATIFSYRRTTFHKMLVSKWSFMDGSATTGYTTGVTGGYWLNTGAVTSLTLLPVSGSFAAGTVISIFGRL